jgi:hypothetical protein
MTEYELVDAIASFNSNMYSWSTFYMTALSAYLVTAYILGAKLTRSQTTIINTCFVVFSALGIFAVRGSGMRCLEFVAEVQAINPERGFALTSEMLWVIVSILLLGIFVCLKFMWDIRHPKTE